MSGYQEQFGLIYDQYIDRIYRFVYLKVNSTEVAEDITSKVFLKGWQSYESSKGGIENVGAFLYQIARNAVVDHYRQEDRTKTVSQDAIAKVADGRTDIHENAALAADLESIKSAIGKLKPEYQDILIFHYLDDMPVPEIAELLQKPQGTVRVMLHRGLNSLRGVLSEQV